MNRSYLIHIIYSNNYVYTIEGNTYKQACDRARRYVNKKGLSAKIFRKVIGEVSDYWVNYDWIAPKQLR